MRGREKGVIGGVVHQELEGEREREKEKKSWDLGEDGGVVGGAEGAEATGAPAVAIDGALDC